MANFQHLLESPFRWAAYLPGAFLRRFREAARARRVRLRRRDYLNG